MTSTDPNEFLRRLQAGDEHARELFFESVYEELRRIAAARGRQEGGPVTTADGLVNTVLARLLGERLQRLDDTDAFRRLFRRELERVLIDAARRRKALKRGGGANPANVPAHELPAEQREHGQVGRTTLHRALDACTPEERELWTLRERGLSNAALAEHFGVSERQIERRLQAIRHRIKREMSD